MANACSVIMRTKKYPTPTASNLAHNAGLKVASYWLNKNPKLLQNIVLKDYKKVNEVWSKWISDIEQRYYDNHNRKMRSDAVRIEEGLVVVGKDVADRENIQKLNRLINAFVEQFEKDNNTKVLHWSIHNHEGKSENDKNIHIHFLFSNVNNNGEMVRRNWAKSYMSELQTHIFECAKPIFEGIERATNYKEQGKKAPKHQHHRVHRENQKNKQIQAEIANLGFNVELKPETTIKEAIKALKQAYTAERKRLKASKEATQKDYQELKQKLQPS